MYIRKPFAVLLLLSTLASLIAADLSFSSVELNTTGCIDDQTDQFLVESDGSFDIRFIPATWILLNSSFALDIPDAEAFFNAVPEYDCDAALDFTGIAVTFPNFLSSSLNLGAFTGLIDDPSTDDLLRTLLRISITPPEFLDMPAGSSFKPKIEMEGTGITVSSVPGNGNKILDFRAFWNTRTNENASISQITRYAVTTNFYTCNSFIGTTLDFFPTQNSFFGGIAAVLYSQATNELYLQAGFIPWTFTAEESFLRHVYFIFEPRLYWRLVDFAVTFFSSPVENETDQSIEGNYFGANFLTAIGNLEEKGIRGGISILGSINPENPGTITPFSFSLSPFCSMMVMDYVCTVTVEINPLLLSEPSQMGEINISLKAVY